MEIITSNVLIGLIGTFVTAFLAYLGLNKKTRADETSIALNAWKELLDPLQQQLKEAKEEIALLRAALEKAELLHKKETNRLTMRIRELEKHNKESPKN